MTNAQFAGLVEQYQRLVYTVCYQLVQDHQLAEDLTQDTFVSAFTHMDSCPPEHYKPWLARIAANKARDHLKSAWARRVSAPGDDGMPQSPPPGAAAPPGPEDLTVTEDEAAAIRQMVRSLKEPYLQVSVMYFLEERSVEEISRALRRPPKTVHTQLFRAKKMLREQIRERSERQ
ncbi:MAG TPA: RNA polymerase sigma factor [Candidatus Fournierella merdipullorum]|uniref:RNA polymerase sigma factor n=1 Tax=Candidatus Allofournierella merdipullorum TaxID=2838595 RepID=A0A9D2E513_9FIRM|nr:RNA polymerase sigma factor [Candidatus Fournierella merdipullorum]